jgi:hypothetical protein
VAREPHDTGFDDALWGEESFDNPPPRPPPSGAAQSVPPEPVPLAAVQTKAGAYPIARSGIFSVPKDESKDRVIVDRRPQNLQEAAVAPEITAGTWVYTKRSSGAPGPANPPGQQTVQQAPQQQPSPPLAAANPPVTHPDVHPANRALGARFDRQGNKRMPFVFIGPTVLSIFKKKH